DRVDGFLHRPEPLNPSPGDTISPYTGQPRIFTPERFRTELESSDLALIVVEAGHWRSNYAVTDELADEIERRVRPIELPAEWRLRAFVWEGGEGASNGPDAGGNPSSRVQPGSSARARQEL